MNGLMRRLPPGSFVWLVLHEIRLGLRARRRGRRGLIIGLILTAFFLGLGIMIALALRRVPIPAGPMIYTGALAAAILLLSFMTTQALLRSQHTLYESRDLDLLLSAPLAPRTVLMAKLFGIAGNVILSFFLLVLPIALPVAILGHPGLFGIPFLLLALALTGACFGLAVTMLIVSLAGPRVARTIGQIVGALLAGAVFLASQFMTHGDGSRRSAAVSLFRWLTDHHIGTGGPGALPGRAALGDPVAAIALLGGAILIFAVTGYLFGRSFLAGYQKATMRLGRTVKATGGIGSRFRSGLFATMFAKEWRLLLRDPALTFQIVLRLIYLMPIAYLAFNKTGGGFTLPSLAFASVLIAGQVAGSFTWVIVSGEDAPDLLTVAPIAKAQVDRAKLASAMALAAPMGLVLPVAIALISPLAALITFAATVAGGLASALIELKWQKPAPRNTFRRRRGGALLAGILSMLAALLFGGSAMLAVWAVG